MIHAETLTPSITLLLRGYDNASNADQAFRNMEDWTLVTTALWFPEHHSAEIMGLTRKQGKVTYRDVLDVFETLATQYEVTSIHYTRASGRRGHKKRIGPRLWINGDRPNPSRMRPTLVYQTDIG